VTRQFTGKRIDCFNNSAGTNGSLHVKNHFLTIYTKISFKYTNGVNVRLLEENARVTLPYIESGNKFLDMTPKA
jgi:hypothetical protein